MYLKWGKINATLPKEMDPDKITLEQAIEVIKARAAQLGETTEKPAKKKAAPKKAKKEAASEDDGEEKPAARKKAAPKKK